MKSSSGQTTLRNFSIFSEESDVSVNSESEKVLTNGNIEDVDSDNDIVKNSERDNDYRPETPPHTPMNLVNNAVKEIPDEIHEDVPKSCFINTFPVTVFIWLILLISSGLLYSRVCDLKAEMFAINEKIVQLENQNEVFKILLKEALEIVTKSNQMKMPANIDDSLVARLVKEKDEIVRKPKTKTVWLGANENQEAVEIIKKNSMLPNFCYFTDKNDLFYDYNIEFCENKKRKLESQSVEGRKNDNKDSSKRDTKQDSSIDELKLDSELYDEYIVEALNSLKDEIEEIKRKRSEIDIFGGATKEVFDVSAKSPEITEKYSKDKKKPKNSKKNREMKSKKVNSGEWDERRMNSRKEARKNLEDQQEDNWYLKRKNEREIDRLETDFGSQKF